MPPPWARAVGFLYGSYLGVGWDGAYYLTCPPALPTYLPAVLLHTASSEEQQQQQQASKHHHHRYSRKQILLLSAQPAARPVLLSPDRPPDDVVACILRMQR